MNNIFYFNYSLGNKDNLINNNEPSGFLVISKNKSENATPLMKANDLLTKLIISYNVVKDIDKQTAYKIIDQINDLIITTKQINYSAFCAYFQVINFSYSAFISQFHVLNKNERRELMKKILDLYIENRHGMYEYHGYSNQALQVSADLSISRRKGVYGINNLKSILDSNNFVHAYTKEAFNNNNLCYLFPDKGDKKLFNEILTLNNIKFTFRETRDNKNPDVLIKINDHIFIIEHKLTNGKGGSQNAEINELVQFINYNEESSKQHYVSCLQGDYFQKLSSAVKEPKIKAQYNNILLNLDKCPNNFFVNGEGFKKIIQDYTSK